MASSVTELRFPLRGRGGRRDDAPAESAPLEQMAEQIRLVDEAASQAAARIAEEAQRLTHPEGSGDAAPRADLLADLASALVERTEEIRDDCDRLMVLLDRAIKVVAAHDAAGAQAPSETRVQRAPAEAELPPPAPAPPQSPAPEPAEPVAELAEPEPSGDARERRPSVEPVERPSWLGRRTGRRSTEGESRGTSEGVRLIATQMAIAGSTRAEIERRLRVQFGVEDATQALDEIFGNRRSEVG